MPTLAFLFAFALTAPGQSPDESAPPGWEQIAVVDGDPVVRGLPRDGIPIIDEPTFLQGRAAGYTMDDDEFVIGIVVDGEARAYSVWQLNTHEIVNDRIGDRPVVVTWCPLCFTGMVYDRRVDGRELRFGIEGALWRENQVMYDRETGSWWSQAVGRGIRGEYEGHELVQLPSEMTTWAEWVTRHPDTLLLSKYTPEGLEGYYDNYAAYHASGNLGITGLRRSAGSRDPKLRIAGFRLDGQPVAIDVEALPDGALFVAEVAGEAVVVSGDATTGVRVFRAGPHAMFVDRDGDVSRLIDRETRSTWDARRGVATAGPLADAALAEVPVTPSYWFAWQAFFPHSTWLAAPQ